MTSSRVSVQGVKSLGGHFACLCWELDFYEVKKILLFFKKKREVLLIIFTVKSLQKEQNSTNLLLWPPICRNKPAITPKWFNSLDTNSNYRPETRMGYCPHCNKLYRTREGLKEHILVVHEKSTPFHCDECPRKFGIQFKLQSHKLIVHSKKNCEICGQQAYNAFELTRHKAAAHGIVPKDVYLCDMCPLFFKHPRNLAKHKETKHPQ